MADPLRVLIIDDEPLGRARIRDLLREYDDVEVLGECTNGRDALTAIRNVRPDLIFLDVQMPEMDGLEVLKSLEPSEIPATVFVTAYDEYAIQAFEFHALDYLLKSFDRERFADTLSRARTQIQSKQAREVDSRLRGLLEDLNSRSKHPDRLLLKASGRIFFLRTAEIDWIEAADNYVQIHAGRQEHLVRETLQSIESKLDPGQFVRIHRSTIVNLDRVKELMPLFHGDYCVRLIDGTELTMSRYFRQRLGHLLSV